VLLWFFCLPPTVNLKPVKLVPGLIAFGVIALVCLVRCARFEFFEDLEHKTFDMRVREAAKFQSPAATNLGFVFMDDDSITKMANGSLGFHYGLFWPRLVFGMLAQELKVQGARAVAFDIVFDELRPSDPQVRMAAGTGMESDEFFAAQIREASNVILAATEKIKPAALFANNALALGDIVTEPAGVLRTAKAFRPYREWHRAFRQVAADPDYGIDLGQARIEKNAIVLPRHGEEGITNIIVPLDKDGNFDLADFVGDKIPTGMARRAKPFTEARMWHMGIVLAAQQLNLDLAHAQVDLPHGRITLTGPAGLSRTIPVDNQGCFYIDWSVPPEDHRRLTEESIQDLLSQYRRRLKDQWI